jgi:N-acetyl-anhydromuramyl-L-alanine amidase AmpD
MSRPFVALALLLALTGCAGYRVIDHPSPNHDGRIRYLVLHFTSQDFAQSLATLTDPHPGRRVSAHYLVSASGEPRRGPRVYRLVPESQRAWHAGESQWQGRQALNDQSIGIEIVYEPSCPTPYTLPSALPDPCTYADYDPAQIALVTRLARDVLARHPDIVPTRVVGHSDIAPSRKSDPGPAFPWHALHAAGIGAWFEDEAVARHRLALEQVRPPLAALLLDALAAYGYGLPHDRTDAARMRDVVVAFQSHFRPARRNGIADLESASIALALLQRYRAEALPALQSKFGLPSSE